MAKILTYDKLILATGARPIIPSIEGIQKKGVRVFKSLKDAERIIRARGRKVVVIGSGLIGVQLAMALCKRRMGGMFSRGFGLDFTEPF